MNKCMAHRGWSGKAPENTLAAFELAINEDKIDSIETDVHMSKDGVPVLIHDFTLERTTNGTGLVNGKTLSELKELDAGSWYSEEYEGEKIPTLEELLIRAKGRIRLNLELKSAGYFYPKIINTVVALVKKYEMEHEVVITSFDHQKIKELKNEPLIETGLVFAGSVTLLEEQLELTGSTVISIAFPFLTKEFAEHYIARGYKIVTWTPNTEEEIVFVKLIHPDIVICTNHPEKVIN
ncbi:glycerophosphodiester phosphodiesterase [Bacillus sp. FJAT-45350]|uniref:glycerophosphodiester phosphodiesterase n=1 Tax=Bacillus sp. FJAT-45350 TaxID=2011014 RepID=UPI000BB754A9|nr:glycerophosphodiester phosphodiesterase family protein [Bacillus sp. FJAT-45350]